MLYVGISGVLCRLLRSCGERGVVGNVTRRLRRRSPSGRADGPEVHRSPAHETPQDQGRKGGERKPRAMPGTGPTRRKGMQRPLDLADGEEPTKSNNWKLLDSGVETKTLWNVAKHH